MNVCHDGTVVAAREDTGDDGTVRTGTAGISAVHRAGLTTWDWATLLKRVWGFDALACSGCGGQTRFIVVITDRAASERILRRMGEDAEEEIARVATAWAAAASATARAARVACARVARVARHHLAGGRGGRDEQLLERGRVGLAHDEVHHRRVGLRGARRDGLGEVLVVLVGGHSGREIIARSRTERERSVRSTGEARRPGSTPAQARLRDHCTDLALLCLMQV